MTIPRPEFLPSDADPAQISPEDVERAKLAWERDAPPEFKRLLDATTDENDQP